MKRTILFAIGFVLVFAACEMPGAGEVAAQVQGQFDDLTDEIQDVVENNEELTEKIDVLQEQITSGTFEMPDFDLDGLMETVEEDFETLSSRSDSLMEEIAQLIETQDLSIDSLKNEINDLEGEIASLRSRVNGLGASSGGSSRTGSSSGSSGRTGSTGGTSGRS